ncbi:hypothetical protein [Dyella nitratireducens]|uniref:Uncharacterized protein n=1 Tax=Dyella nitratireducens TaxID=1849580 RepID=A0ABQ1FRY9_9GAMM|nr:hypothetical protein [Dyella nitratireducens]GGA28698.1 hypothetical protein GCM10010981_16890 [Dyella nitratireducens]GLQ43246.1 hypothetical protein GCM10007902_30960 [Dyella nitratireducens]
MASSKERNPAWVAKAKSDAASSFFAAGDEHHDRLIQIVNDLASAKGIASAWKSLEKRFEDFEQRRKLSFQNKAEALRSFDEVHAALSSHGLQPIPSEMHVHLLADACFRAHDGFKGFVALSGQEQSDAAKKVAKQAKELAKTLSILVHPIFGLPEEFDLDDAALDIHQDHYRRWRSMYANENLWNKDWHAGYCAGGFDFAQVTANELPRLLAKLAEGAEIWGKKPPSIAKPKSEDAHRTYFIKCLASYFAEQYGDPMEKSALAFTKVFFKSASTLTVSSIKEMTTVKRKRSRASRQ